MRYPLVFFEIFIVAPLVRRVNRAALPDRPTRKLLPAQDLKKQKSASHDKTSGLHAHHHRERRIYSQYIEPRSPNSLPWAYLSGENLLSQILSIDDRMEPPKGGPAHLGGAEHMRIQSAIMNLGPPKCYVIKFTAYNLRIFLVVISGVV